METASKNPAAAKPATARKKRFRKAARRLAYAAVGLLGILLVIFFLLPVWISNEQGRTYVLQQINKNMKAKVAIEDWSLGWFRGTELKNVTITLPDGTRLLSAPRVQSELTLWGILWGHYDVGITKVDTAQLAITRYADGSSSLDSLFEPKTPTAGVSRPGAAEPAIRKMFQTLRGSLQVGSAVVTINSMATGKSITYTDVKAGVTIASPEAPFHVQISAVGGATGPGEVNVSLNATLPALGSWPAPAWAMVSDVELSASHFPTALACDYAGLDPRWEDSLGPEIEKLHFSNHATPPLETSLPALEIRGTGGAYIDANMLLRAAGDPSSGTATATLSLPAPGSVTDDFHAAAAVRISAPLAGLLARINPLLGAAQNGEGFLEIHITELNITAGNTENAGATARLIFPPLRIARNPFISELLKSAGGPQVNAAAEIRADAEPLRLRLAAGQFSYDNFTIVCARNNRLTFSGTAALDGTLNLLATLPATGTDTLSSSRTDIPITGTTAKPIITLPR